MGSLHDNKSPLGNKIIANGSDRVTTLLVLQRCFNAE